MKPPRRPTDALRVEPFAKVPLAVMKSEACRTLSHMKFRVLVALAAQYRGANNGLLVLPRKAARELGIDHPKSLTIALKELRGRGLIILTKQGGLHPFGLNHYALGWAALNGRDGVRLVVPEPAPNLWQTWQAELIRGTVA